MWSHPSEKPKSITGKAVPSARAEEYEELCLMREDMKSTLIAAKLLRDEFFPPEEAFSAKESVALALWRDSIVQLTDCYSPRRKHHLKPEAVFAGEQHGLSVYQWFLDVRDTYAAHGFGAGRQCIASLFFDGNEIGIGHHVMSAPQWSPENINNLFHCIDITREFVEDRAALLLAEMMAEMQELSPEEIGALPTAQLHVPSRQEFGESRHRFRKIKAGEKLPRSRKRGRSSRSDPKPQNG